VQSQWVDNPDFLGFGGVNEFLANGNVGITLKIYKRSFLEQKKIKLKEDIRAYHDIIFVAETMAEAHKIRIIRGLGYYYRKDEILSTTRSKKNFYNIVNAAEHIFTLLKKPYQKESRIAALTGYCLTHLLHYYHLCSRDKKLKAVKALIRLKVAEVLEEANSLHIHPSKAGDVKKIFGYEGRLKLSKAHEFNYKSCPPFGGEYFKEERFFNRLKVDLYFYAYLAYQSPDPKDVDNFRDKLLNMISNFPGLATLPLTHFIERYIKEAVFHYGRNRNQRWYIAFLMYLNEHVDSSYFANIVESVNDFTLEDHMMNNFPKLADKFPCEFSDLNDTFRENKVVASFSRKYQQDFLEYITGKSVAVIGNAACERGERRGAEIDGHDVVIRFNNFVLSEEFKKDYGEKVNIWGITPGIESLNMRDDLFGFDFVFSPCVGIELSSDRCRLLYNYLLSGAKYFQISSIEARSASNIVVPSVGLYALHYLSQHREKMSKVSIYGFDPVRAQKKARHYFKGDLVATKNLKFHDWQREEQYLNHLKIKIK